VSEFIAHVDVWAIWKIAAPPFQAWPGTTCPTTPGASLAPEQVGRSPRTAARQDVMTAGAKRLTRALFDLKTTAIRLRPEPRSHSMSTNPVMDPSTAAVAASIRLDVNAVELWAPDQFRALVAELLRLAREDEHRAQTLARHVKTLS